MWKACLIISVLLVLVILPVSYAVISLLKKHGDSRKKGISFFNVCFAAVFIAVCFMFAPAHRLDVFGIENGWVRGIQLAALCLFKTIQLFTAGCEFEFITKAMDIAQYVNVLEPEWRKWYELWAAILYVAAPALTFTFIASLFKNLFSHMRYIWEYYIRKSIYVFSELNEKSLALARDIKSKHKKAVIVFTDVFEDNNESIYELIYNAKSIGAILFKKDILLIRFKKFLKNSNVYFFTIGSNETENLNQALKLIEAYKGYANTHLYVFSTNVESEILLTAVDKGLVKVRRINEVKSLINRILYENGEIIFESARDTEDNTEKCTKHISAIVVGMGMHGTEMVKALTWFGQMDGYSLEINAFDKDPLAEEKFKALAPELMADDYNGVAIPGEAQYTIKVHPDIEVESYKFAEKIKEIKNATYVMVALGNDSLNINTAVNLRMYFERMKIKPVIQAIVYNTQQKNALYDIENYRGQKYNIDFVGDVESSYAENVIIDSELEDEALQRHLKWGKEEEFWIYEYNYRSSVASAIHLKARIKCGIKGAEKPEDEITEEERIAIESLEHRRWNAYMRAEGYIYSGSNDKSTRNDLAKMHHDLVDYSSLSSEEKAKDSKLGTL